MKFKYVSILGRPGCGKSALYRELEKRLLASGQAKTFERVDDFPKLWAKLLTDDALEEKEKRGSIPGVSLTRITASPTINS